MHCNDIPSIWHCPPSSMHSNQDYRDKVHSEIMSLQFNSLFRPFSNYDGPATSYRHTYSDAGEEEKQKLSLTEDRRKRRMISNRESARRSRLRKQKQLHVLWSMANNFQSLNRQLLDELNYKMEVFGQILQENALLRRRKLELLKVDDATVLVLQSGTNVTNSSCINTSDAIREAIQQIKKELSTRYLSLQINKVQTYVGHVFPSAS